MKNAHYTKALLQCAAVLFALLLLIFLAVPLREEVRRPAASYIRERRDTIPVVLRDTLSSVLIQAKPRSRRFGGTTNIIFDTLIRADPATLAPDTVSINLVDSNGAWDLFASYRFAPRERTFAIPVTLRDSIIELAPPPKSWGEVVLSILSLLGAAAVGWLIRGLF